jgi:D-glycero-D-manno-heptose 1,7-bisphosphate phosphatase
MADSSPRLVVLDRDGVINRESPDFIRSPTEWVPIPGSLEAIAALTRGGFQVVVATNQSGVGRGLFTAAMLTTIHDHMRRQIEHAGGKLAGIFVCPHHPDECCECRKPRPGLLRQIERQFACSLAAQPVVGDSERDIRAAQAVGARSILVRTGNGREAEKMLRPDDRVQIFDDLAGVVRALLSRPADGRH